jgi:protein-tyrosine phosphatase
LYKAKLRKAGMKSSGPFSLKTVWNFRDLGGYITSTGGVIRSGLVFRSGDLSGLEHEDASIIASLGLRTVLDLRYPADSAKRPDRRDGLSANWVQADLTTPVYYELAARIASGHLSESDSLAYMRSITTSIVLERIEEIQAIFYSFMQPDAFPILMHCSVGKDRTGVVAALLLSALGVPEETVYADYMLSNDYLVPFREAQIKKPGREHTKPVWEVRREYLEGALAAVRDSYGSLDRYLENAIGLTDEMRTELKGRFLIRAEE